MCEWEHCAGFPVGDIISCPHYQQLTHKLLDLFITKKGYQRKIKTFSEEYYKVTKEKQITN